MSLFAAIPKAKKNGIYSVQGGEKAIKPLNDKELNVSLEPFSAVYFDIYNGSVLTRDH